MPRLCDRCGCEVPDEATVGDLSLIVTSGSGLERKSSTLHRVLCEECIVDVSAGPDDVGRPLELLEAPFAELQAMDTRRETALMAATQIAEGNDGVLDVLATATRFLEWLRQDDEA